MSLHMNQSTEEQHDSLQRDMNQTKHGQSTGQHDANQLRRSPYELAYDSEHRGAA